MLTRKVLAVFFFSMVLRAQSPGASSAEPLIKSDVRQVLVPVVVTDRSGHYVSGLGAHDFQVLEDGKAQRIVAVSYERIDAPPEQTTENSPASGKKPSIVFRSQGTAAAPALPRRTYLIVVDTLHSSFANFGRVRDALGKFLEHEHTVETQYALIALGREAKVVQDSTRDPAVIVSAIRSMNFVTTIRDSESSNTATAANQFVPLVSAYCGACRCNGQGSPVCISPAKYSLQQFLTSFSERTMILNQEFLAQLREIVRASAGMPTSHTIVFISDGFNRFPGRELYGILQGYGVRDSSFLFNPRDLQPELEGVLKLATKSDAKFYTIDSRGVYSEGSLPGSNYSATSSQVTPHAVDSEVRSVARENTDALAELAHETGGLFYEHNNDLLKGIRQAFEDGREYYVIAYVPENKALDGRYKKISVTGTDKKWQIKGKAGYWATAN